MCVGLSMWWITTVCHEWSQNPINNIKYEYEQILTIKLESSNEVLFSFFDVCVEMRSFFSSHTFVWVFVWLVCVGLENVFVVEVQLNEGHGSLGERYLNQRSRSRMIRAAPPDAEGSWITVVDLITLATRYRATLHLVFRFRKMSLGRRGTLGLLWIWVALWILQIQVCLGYSMIVWTAYVELRYSNPGTNQTQNFVCECGMYGADSLLQEATGIVTLPDSDPFACQPNTSFNISKTPWIALIKRGNCTHAEKILAAKKAGAAAVVIYNLDGTGNGTNTMTHSGKTAYPTWSGARNSIWQQNRTK